MEFYITAIMLGLCLSSMSLGIFISMKIFNIPDITTDGSYTLGAVITAILFIAHWPAMVMIPVVLIAGAIEAKNYDVIFYGEEHNDSVSHYAEKMLLAALYDQYNKGITLSMEMFDRDVQGVMNEYLTGSIREKDFKKDARVWSNYKDYRPMVEFAKEKQLDVICANAPSRYTNLAGRKGEKALEVLPAESKKYFAPLPYDTATGKYYQKLQEMSGHTMAPQQKDTGKAAMPVMMMPAFDLVVAQSLWDATMAYSISEYMKTHASKKIMQVNGKFHSEEGFAVVEQLKKYNPKAKILIISSATDDAFPKIDWSQYKQFGDYILITDPKIPKTF